MCNEDIKFQELGQVLSNECIAPNVYVMEITAPRICEAARPGQFVHVKVADNPVQLLRMPFGVYDCNPQIGSIEICFQVLGEGTRQLSTLSIGERMDVLGPIGNGWSMPQAASHALIVSGGLGAAPMNLLARELCTRGCTVDIVMGGPSSERLVCRERLAKSALESGGKLLVSTDDGSEGVHGFCTQISDELLRQEGQDYDYICVCGPGPMERNAVKLPLELGIYTEASFEKLMACGIGACLSCIVETVDGRKRCCVDGPVFDVAKVVW